MPSVPGLPVWMRLEVAVLLIVGRVANPKGAMREAILLCTQRTAPRVLGTP